MIVLLIMGALLSVIAIKLTLNALTRVENAQEALRGTENEIYAESCMQEALLRLRRDAGYLGGVVPVAPGTCTVAVTGAGNERTIDATGVLAPSYTYRLKVKVTLVPFAVVTWDN